MTPTVGTAVLLVLAVGCALAAEPLTLGRQRQLFLDDYVVGCVEGLERVVNQPTRYADNPIITGDHPWERRSVQLYGTVLYDEALSRFRMWYLCIPGGEAPVQVGDHLRVPYTTLTAYAESRDGFHWEKPTLGQVSFQGSTVNNLLAIGRDNTEGIAILEEPRDPDPTRRFKALYWEHTVLPDGVLLDTSAHADGLWVSFSPDGLRWANHPGNPVIEVGSDTAQTVVYDPGLQRYVAFGRFGFGRRVARAESPDFVHWTPPEPVLECDEADGPNTQFYGIQVDRYEGFYLGMLWVFREGGDGCIDTQLGVSRDGRHWERVAHRQTFLPLGEPGGWEDGMVRSVARIIPCGDTLFIYYCGVNGPHRPGVVRKSPPAIGVATLRRDGFVSLDAGPEQGVLVTKPLIVPPGRLEVNADAQGGLVVEVLDEAGTELPGLSWRECRAVRGDACNHEVRWAHSDLTHRRGQAIRLRFVLRQAKLYSFWFG